MPVLPLRGLVLTQSIREPETRGTSRPPAPGTASYLTAGLAMGATRSFLRVQLALRGHKVPSCSETKSLRLWLPPLGLGSGFPRRRRLPFLHHSLKPDRVPNPSFPPSSSPLARAAPPASIAPLSLFASAKKAFSPEVSPQMCPLCDTGFSGEPWAPFSRLPLYVLSLQHHPLAWRGLHAFLPAGRRATNRQGVCPRSLVSWCPVRRPVPSDSLWNEGRYPVVTQTDRTPPSRK